MLYPPLRIHATDDQLPPKQNHYKANHDKRLIIERHVAEWYQKVIIEPTTSPSAPPVLIVPKKTGDWPVCTDSTTRLCRTTAPLQDYTDRLIQYVTFKYWEKVSHESMYNAEVINRPITMLFFKWIDKNQQHWAKVMYQKKLYQQLQDQVKFEALPKIRRQL